MEHFCVGVFTRSRVTSSKSQLFFIICLFYYYLFIYNGRSDKRPRLSDLGLIKSAKPTQKQSGWIESRGDCASKIDRSAGARCVANSGRVTRCKHEILSRPFVNIGRICIFNNGTSISTILVDISTNNICISSPNPNILRTERHKNANAWWRWWQWKWI